MCENRSLPPAGPRAEAGASGAAQKQTAYDMLPLLFLGLLFLVILAVLLGLGVGLGTLLNWMLPGIDLGLGVLIGVVSAASSIYFVSWLVALMEAYAERDQEIDEVVLRELVSSGLQGGSARRRKRA